MNFKTEFKKKILSTLFAIYSYS